MQLLDIVNQEERNKVNLSELFFIALHSLSSSPVTKNILQ